MYCTLTSKETGLPIRDSEAKTRVENRALFCALSSCKVHLESPRISRDSDLGTSVTRTSVIGFLLLLVILKFRSAARPAIMVTSEESLRLALPAGLPVVGPVTVEARMILSRSCMWAEDGATLKPPSGGFGSTLDPRERGVDLLFPFGSLYVISMSRFCRVPPAELDG